ncbi:MAG TPA: pyridoxamine 5'-phosphate oxidase family protein [Solirubrobacteraceae bacterium]|nr:pyridoxamine 5'-phosphate oxidase family protein [Solirubrobacteraceae bacterium]
MTDSQLSTETRPERDPSRAAKARPASERVRLRRKRERGSHERAVIDAILDEGLIAHLGIVEEDGQPFVIPTLHARRGDVVYVHGSAAGRAMKTLARGARACLTVSLLDGLVLARSAMHHSANYRSVMLLGTARVVDDPAEKRAALEAVVEHIVPGRSPDVRPPTDNELKATSVLALTIDEASAKVRTGPPVDDEEDYALQTWAGVLPMRSVPGEPRADERLAANVAVPEYVSAYARPARV